MKSEESSGRKLEHPEFWLPGDIAFCRTFGRFYTNSHLKYTFRVLVLEVFTKRDTARVLVLKNEEFPDAVWEKTVVSLEDYSLEVRPE